MKKSRDLFEHLKTGILVVLFFITILLLYLCLNQHGTTFSLSDILKGNRSVSVVVDADSCLNPIMVVRSNGNGSFSICSNDMTKAAAAADSCAENLLPAGNGKFTQISGEIFTRMAMEEGSVQEIFGFDYPFDEYCQMLIGKTLDHPEGFTGFDVILFSQSIKSDLYFRNKDGECWKFSVAENYYSTEAMAQVLTFDREISYNDLYVAAKKNNTTLEGFDFDDIPGRIFGDNFDFVRRITDGSGNRTYMYGYGQKRLTVYVDGSMEFKEDIKSSDELEFYSSLQTALIFIEGKTGIDDQSLRLCSVQHNTQEQTYEYIFKVGEYEINIHAAAGGVNYFSMGRSGEFQ